MARVTSDAVLEILTETQVSNLDPFISVAHQMVAELCEPNFPVPEIIPDSSSTTEAVEDTSSENYEKLYEIERWLSAHFVCIADPRTQSIGLGSGDIQESLFGKVGLRLQVSRYGQMALVLDTSGALADANNRPETGTKTKLGWNWLGTDYE